MIFINTRPAQRAKPLTDFLQSQGVNVLDLPLLELVKCELSSQEKNHLTHINDYQALIFISETAVTYFFDFINNHRISLNSSLTFIAVGQKTGEIFKHFWQKITNISPNLITPSQFNLPENNEGLLQLPCIQNLKNIDKILILKGKDGRDLLKNSLVKNGINVHEVNFYQRISPSTSEQIFQNIYPNFPEKTIVLITSLTAWRHWQVLCEKHHIDTRLCHYLALQARIFNHLRQSLPEQNLVEISNLHPETIFLASQAFKWQ